MNLRITNYFSYIEASTVKFWNDRRKFASRSFYAVWGPHKAVKSPPRLQIKTTKPETSCSSVGSVERSMSVRVVWSSE